MDHETTHVILVAFVSIVIIAGLLVVFSIPTRIAKDTAGKAFFEVDDEVVDFGQPTLTPQLPIPEVRAGEQQTCTCFSNADRFYCTVNEGWPRDCRACCAYFSLEP